MEHRIGLNKCNGQGCLASLANHENQLNKLFQTAKSQ